MWMHLRYLSGDRASRGAVAALTAIALTLPVAPARAITSSGCTAANRGTLDAELSAAGATMRQLALDAGDTVTLSVRALQGAAASVTLASGAGAPQTLIGNSSAAAVSFRAPRADTYAFRFSAGPGGSASVGVTCTSAEVAAASAAFLTRRKDLLNTKEPDRIHIDRTPTPIANPDKPLSSTVAVDDAGNTKQVQFSVSLSEITAAAHPGQKPEPGFVDLWLEGRMENYDTGTADIGTSNGNLGVLYLGTRTKLGPDILLGGLAQFDRGIEQAGYGESELEATGWMAGPYLSMKLASGVIFDGRAAWGETENAVPGLGAADDQIERRLVRAKLTGTREVEGWKVAPSVGLVYLEDAVSDGASGEATAAGTGRVEVLPEVSRRFEVDGDAFIEPRAALGGFVAFDEFSALDPKVLTDSADDLQLKAEAGVAVGVKDGTSLQALGGVESGSETTPENWMGRLQLNVPLGK
jgi:hypothetical protein